jgi:hypothetical protein
MIEASLDRETGSDTTNDIAGNRAPPAADTTKIAPQVQDEGADTGDDLDLLVDDGEESADASADAADATDTDAERPAWQRPEGLEGDELVAWKGAQGLPVEPDDIEVELELKEGQQVTEVGQQLIDGVKAFAVEHDMPGQTVNGLVQWYQQQIDAQQAKLKEADAAHQKAARAALSEAEIAAVKSASKGLPQDLRQMLREARLPDGRLLQNQPAVLRMLAGLNAKGKATRMDNAAADEQEIERIKLVRRNNIQDYYSQDLHLKLERLESRKAARAPAPEGPRPTDKAREAEIRKAMARDFEAYSRSPMRNELTEIMRRRGAE